jgi:glycosyltransferase involved in cell wall biosynthesis
VAQQTFPGLEHLVIDGNSTDGTLDEIRGLAHPHLRWLSEPDEGLYYALNKGLALARGEVIGFLHADDFFAHDEVLESIAGALSDPRYDACYGDLEYVASEDVSRVVRRWKSEEFVPGMFGRGWMPPHPTFYARSGVYRRFGGFDTRFSLGADWDLMMRLFEVKRIRSLYLPSVLVRMRTGGLSNRNWRNVLRNNVECVGAFRKYGRAVSASYPLAKLCHRLAQFR